MTAGSRANLICMLVPFGGEYRRRRIEQQFNRLPRPLLMSIATPRGRAVLRHWHGRREPPENLALFVHDGQLPDWIAFADVDEHVPIIRPVAEHDQITRRDDLGRLRRGCFHLLQRDAKTAASPTKVRPSHPLARWIDLRRPPDPIRFA